MKAKYLKKTKKKALFPMLIGLAVLVLVGLIVLVVVLGAGESGAGSTRPTAVPTGDTQSAAVPSDAATTPVTPEDPTGTTQVTDPTPMTTIETAYCTLQISEENAGKLRHREIVEKKVAMEIFSMVLDGQEKELFRIYFGDSGQGDPVGYLLTEQGKVSISTAASIYEAEDFANEDDFSLYHTLMEELNVVLASIRRDSRYREQDEVEVTQPQKTDTELRHWKFELPETMEWTEATKEGVYRADFYATVAGEKVRLYSVYLGETEADSLIGYYVIDGQQKPVWVTVYELVPKESWSEKELVEVYNQMATINDVIQTIMASEGFSEFKQE